MFYLAGLLRLAERLGWSRMDACLFSSLLWCSGVADAEPRLLAANGQSRISQVCQPLPCFFHRTGTDVIITRQSFHFGEDILGFSGVFFLQKG